MVVGNPELPFIYNVSQHVGPGKANLGDDCELIRFFLAEILKKPGPDRRVNGPAPTMGRDFDLITGFWLFEYQFLMHEKGQATIDGVASPAHGVTISYPTGKFWLIGALNYSYKHDYPDNFPKLHEDSRLSMTLRNSIGPV